MVDNGNKNIVEALVFASDFPLAIKKICEIIDDLSVEEAEKIIEDLQKDYDKLERGFKLQKVAGGYEFVTLPEYAVWIKKLLVERKKASLTRAGLETAAIIAYRQPVVRADIEKIRGVDCGGTLRTLLERNLIKITGRDKSPGRPLIYATTDEFLRYFGVSSLEDLPRLEEIEDIIQHDAEKAGMAVEQLSFSSGNSGSEEV